MFIVVSEDILLQNQAKVKSNPKVELDEESLSYLFNETYPHNTNLKEINIKVSALNTLYSTHLRSYTFNVAKHIHSLAIDDRLKQGDITLVDDIIKTPRGEGKQFRCYSFATKYCSFHRPDIFPIYDSYVDKPLVHLQKQDGFAGDVTLNNRDYSSYVSALKAFQDHYNLNSYSLKEVDKYLWQLGFDLKQQTMKETYDQ